MFAALHSLTRYMSRSDGAGNSDHSLAEFIMDAFATQVDYVASPLVPEAHQSFQFDPMLIDVSHSTPNHNVPALSSGLLHGL
jgi:hypothetical protein